jgi:cytochrome c peroxidase
MRKSARQRRSFLLLVLALPVWIGGNGCQGEWPLRGAVNAQSVPIDMTPSQPLPIPLGLPADTWTFYIPADNRLTAEKVALGRQLFFDPLLSADGTISCASCHQPQRGFADAEPLAVGIGGRRGTRNSMSLLNVIYNPAQFWDGRTDTLEEQALQPLTHPDEMGNSNLAEVLIRIRNKPEYQAAFRGAFGEKTRIEAREVAMALASYERTLLSGNSPFDRFQSGDETALSADARRGLALFRGRGRCSRCHVVNEQQPLFTNFAYQNTGVAAGAPSFDRLARLAARLIEGAPSPRPLVEIEREVGSHELGRALHSGLLFEIGSYRTPSLRNVGITAPYFHDGSAKSLAEVVQFYNRGGRTNLNLDEELHPLGLTAAEERDLVQFLESLTGMPPPDPSPLPKPLPESER